MSRRATGATERRRVGFLIAALGAATIVAAGPPAAHTPRAERPPPAAPSSAPGPPSRLAWLPLPIPRALDGAPLELAARAVVAGDRLYAAGGGCVLGTGGLPTLRCAGTVTAVDMTDPERPRVAATHRLGEATDEIADLAVAGDAAFLAVRRHGADLGDVRLRLHVLDVRAPDAIARLVDAPLPGRGADGVSLAAGGGWVHVASDGGWTSYDVTEPAAPVVVGRRDDGARALALDGAALYVAAADGLRVYDVADPAASRLVGTSPAGAGSRWLRVRDRLALVRRDALCPSPGPIGGRDVRCGDLVEALDATDPAAATPIGPVWGGRGVNVAAAEAGARYVYIASGGLHVLDRAHPDLAEVARYAGRAPHAPPDAAASVVDVRASGGRLALLVDTGREVALDIVTAGRPATAFVPLALRGD